MRKLLLIPTLAALFAAPAQAQPAKATCTYFDDSRNIALINQPCTLDPTEINGHFEYIVRFNNGEKITVEYLQSVDANHQTIMNGKPGWGYEIYRTQFHGATNDLNEIIDWNEATN